MRHLTRAALISAGMLFFTDPGAAQQDTGTRLRKQFDDCVYASVGQQWTANIKTDPNIAAENAFLACQTEEQAIYSVLGLSGVPQQQAAATVVGIKLQLKRSVREIMADPTGYYKKHK